MILTHASLFSGIGGFDLAAEWAGFHNLFHCEINEFSKQVLKYHFPESVSYEDITKTDFRGWRGKVTVLSGGFPCQPFSVSGQRKGSEDDRYLWPEMLRAIDEIRPDWVIGENVAGILSMAQPGSIIGVENQTSLFEENNEAVEIIEQEYIVELICKDLEQIGYNVQPVVIPACAVGAPHRRDRIWFIANRTDSRIEDMYQWKDRSYQTNNAPNANSKMLQEWINIKGWENCKENKTRIHIRTKRSCCVRLTPNANNFRLQGRLKEDRSKSAIYSKAMRLCARYRVREGRAKNWEKFPIESPIYTRDDGVSYQLAGRSISNNRWREEAVKACGNAIVPQIAYEIFNNIKQIEL